MVPSAVAKLKCVLSRNAQAIIVHQDWSYIGTLCLEPRALESIATNLLPLQRRWLETVQQSVCTDHWCSAQWLYLSI